MALGACPRRELTTKSQRTPRNATKSPDEASVTFVPFAPRTASICLTRSRSIRTEVVAFDPPLLPLSPCPSPPSAHGFAARIVGQDALRDWANQSAGAVRSLLLDHWPGGRPLAAGPLQRVPKRLALGVEIDGPAGEPGEVGQYDHLLSFLVHGSGEHS